MISLPPPSPSSAAATAVLVSTIRFLSFSHVRRKEDGGKFIHTVGGSLWSIVGDSSIQRLLKREGGNWMNNPWH